MKLDDTILGEGTAATAATGPVVGCPLLAPDWTLLRYHVISPHIQYVSLFLQST